jgi:VCBS repeat-containing protein
LPTITFTMPTVDWPDLKIDLNWPTVDWPSISLPPLPGWDFSLPAINIRLPDIYLPSIPLPDFNLGFSIPTIPIDIGLPDLNLPGQTTTPLTAGVAAWLEKKYQQPALQFPIIDDPLGGVIDMLMGKPADLMLFTPPDLAVKVGFRQTYPVYPPLFVGLGGEIGLEARLTIGFDTYGITEYFASGNILDILDGFYIDDNIVGARTKSPGSMTTAEKAIQALRAGQAGQDLPEVTLLAKLYAFAELNGGIIRGGVEGGIKMLGTLDIFDEDMDNKYRAKELIAAISEDPLDVVEMHLRGSAYISAYLDLFAIFDYVRVFEYTFMDVTLFEWEHDPRAKKPVLGSMEGNELTLHMGSTIGSIDGHDSIDKGAIDRLRRSTNDGDEQFILTGSGGTIDVSALLPNSKTYTKAFTGVSLVKAYAGEGNDLIDASALDVSVLFVAGAGTDTLIGGSADDVLIGSDTGTAILIGNGGNDLLIARGGSTDMQGGLGDDTYRFLGDWGTVAIDDGAGANVIDFSPQIRAVTIDDSEHQGLQGSNSATWTASTTVDRIKGGLGSDILDFSGDEGNLLVTLTGKDQGWAVGPTASGMNQTGLPSNTTVTSGFGFKFEGIENLVGGQGSDVVRVQNGAWMSGSIYGDTSVGLHHDSTGNENANARNTLDFSEYTTSVKVDEEGLSGFGSGGASNITVRGFHNLFGGSAGDKLAGDGRNNLIVGNGGNDILEGKAGHDLLVADQFKTRQVGAASAYTTVSDYLSLEAAGLAEFGGTGRTWIWKGQTLQNISLPGAGTQVLKGGAGNDIIMGALGGDIINIGGTGEGNDTIMADLGVIDVDYQYRSALYAKTLGNFGGGDDAIYLGSGSNVVLAGDGNDTIEGVDAADSFNIVLADNGAVQFQTALINVSGHQKKTFATTDGLSHLIDFIEAPVDETNGSGGDDTVNLASGSAIVLGGAGADAIRFTAAASTGANVRFIAGDHARLTADSHGGIVDFHSLDIAADTGGNDTIVIGSKDDLATRNLGVNFVIAGMGNDTVLISAATDSTTGALSRGQAESEDVVLGDNGSILRTDSVASPATRNAMLQIKSTVTGLGGDDVIVTANGGKVLIGGMGADQITAGDGTHIVFGDNTQIDYDGTALNGVLRELVSTDIALGGDDQILLGEGFTIAVGGYGKDVIDIVTQTTAAAVGIGYVTGVPTTVGVSAGEARGRTGRFVGGDNVRVRLDAKGGVTDVETLDIVTTTGDDDTVTIGIAASTAELGINVVAAGMGNDSITVVDTTLSFDVLLGDNGEVHRNDYATDTPYALRDVHSTQLDKGGDDHIVTGGGDKVVLGGFGADLIAISALQPSSSHKRFVTGDNATLTFDTLGGLTDLVTTDTQITTGGDDRIDIGASLAFPTHFGLNMVAGGMGNDIVLAGGATRDPITGQYRAGTALSEDILIGDNGEIHRTEATAASGNLNQMLQVKTIVNDKGGDDVLASGSGGKVIIGGFGADIIKALDGTHLVLGDNAQLDYDAVAKNGVLRQLQATEIVIGGADDISLREGYKIVVGGIGADVIDIAATGVAEATSPITVTGIAPLGQSQTENRGRIGRHVAGDNARVLFDEKSGWTDFQTIDAIAATGGNDSIVLGAAGTTADLGYQLVFGGMGSDVVTVRNTARSEDILFGDNGELHRKALSYAAISLFSTNTGLGGADTIRTGRGNKILVGGFDADVIDALTVREAGKTERVIVLGDSGTLNWDLGGGETLQKVESLSPGFGGDDNVTVGDGDVTFIGGYGRDRLQVNSTESAFRIAAGDNAQYLYSGTAVPADQAADVISALTLDQTSPTGDGDVINIGITAGITGDMGKAIVIGGMGTDAVTVTGATADATLIGDNVSLLRTAGFNGVFTSITSLLPDQGAGDVLQTVAGPHILIGGMGADTLRTGKGAGIVFGDSAALAWSAGKIASAESVGIAQGGNDTIELGAGLASSDGNQIVVGGFGADSITLQSSRGDGVTPMERAVAGDNAKMIFDANGRLTAFATADSDASTGGGDNIVLVMAGDVAIGNPVTDFNVVAGGMGNDQISINGATRSIDVIGGDNLDYRRSSPNAGNPFGQHLFADVLQPFAGGDDTIRTGSGDKLILAGAGNDRVDTQTVAGDRNIVFGDAGAAVFDTAANGLLQQLMTTAESSGGNDSITLGAGIGFAFGGLGNDRLTINAGDSVERVVAGDNAQVNFTNGIASLIQTTGNDGVDPNSAIDEFSLPGVGANFVLGGPGVDLSSGGNAIQSAGQVTAFLGDSVIPGSGSISVETANRGNRVVSVVVLGEYGEMGITDLSLVNPQSTPGGGGSGGGGGTPTWVVTGYGEVVEDAANTTVSGALVYPALAGGVATFVTGTQTGSYGSLTLGIGGSWSYTLDGVAADPLQTGDVYFETFRVTTTDGSETTITIKVSGSNDAPVAAAGTLQATEDQTASGTLPVATDVDNATLTYALSQAAAHGTVVVNADGSFSYTPDADYNGADSFLYSVSDGVGGSAIAVVDITVHAVNDAPVAVDGTLQVLEDQTVQSTLPVATDVDSVNLTYALGQTAAHGTVLVNADGTYSYTPAANYNGPDRFFYTVSDGQLTATAAIDITVTAVNDVAIISGTTTGQVSEDGILAASGQLTVQDVDAGEAKMAPAKLIGSYGTLTLDAGGRWQYLLDNADPVVQALNAGASLTDHFDVTSWDGSATVGININIAGANEPLMPSIIVNNGGTGGVVIRPAYGSASGATDNYVVGGATQPTGGSGDYLTGGGGNTVGEPTIAGILGGGFGGTGDGYSMALPTEPLLQAPPVVTPLTLGARVFFPSSPPSRFPANGSPAATSPLDDASRYSASQAIDTFNAGHDFAADEIPPSETPATGSGETGPSETNGAPSVPESVMPDGGIQHVAPPQQEQTTPGDSGPQEGGKAKPHKPIKSGAADPDDLPDASVAVAASLAGGSSSRIVWDNVGDNRKSSGRPNYRSSRRNSASTAEHSSKIAWK